MPQKSFRFEKKLTYSDKLKDPRWQKKRLEVLARDAFTCRWCAAKDKTLNVHHRYYLARNEPWDYPGTALLTLCIDCHEEVALQDKALLVKLCDLGIGPYDVQQFHDLLTKAEQFRHLIEILYFPGIYAVAKSLLDQDYAAFESMSKQILSEE